MQNDMTSYLETFEKERFCGFPHRHGEATGKAETRDKTRGCRKISISYETSSNFHSLKHAARLCFPASPIDMATPQENQRLATRDETHGCSKTSILCETSGNFHRWQHDKRTGFPAFPIDTATPQENQRLETRHVDAEKSAFRTRLPPIFIVTNMTKGEVLQLPP